MEERADLEYRQALRYAEDLRELYEREQARTAELEAAEAVLREAEARYRALVENIPAVTYLDELDPDGPRRVREVYVSPQIEDLLGYRPSDVTGDPNTWTTLIHPDDRERVLAEDVRHYTTGQPLDQEYRMVSRDGRVVWVRDVAAILRDDEGRPRFVQGVVHDITQGKLSEEAMRRYTARLEILHQIDLAILAAHTIDELIRAALSRLRNLVPSRRATVWLLDMEARTATAFIASGDRQPARGVEFPLERWGSFGDTIIQALRSGRAEMRPDLAEETELAPGVQALRDEGIRSLLVAPLNEQGELTGALALYADAPGAFGPEDQEIASEVANQLAIAIRHARLRQALEEELAERRRTEDTLAEVSRRMSLILESAGEGIYGVDLEGNATFVNPAGAKMLGWEPGDLLGRQLHPLIHHARPDGSPCPPEECPIYAAFRDGGIHRVTEDVFWRKDGSSFPVEYTSTPIREGGRLTGAVVTFSDITQRRQAEGELRETMDRLRRIDEQRQRLLSRLVSAQEEERKRIAEDIHDDSLQAMAAVGMQLDLLRSRLGDPKQLEVVAGLEETVALTIGRLRKLLFELRPRALDAEGLAPALRFYVDQHREEGGPTYRLQNKMRREPPTEVRVILYRIAQEVLANVRKHASASTVEIVLEERDGGFLVRIEDDGSGFSPEDDSTQRPGHLGLAAIRERAEMAGGWWRIESAPGAGTTAEFWLPLSTSPMEGDG